MSQKYPHPYHVISLLAGDKESTDYACKLVRSVAQWNSEITVTFNKMGQHYGDLGNQMFQAAMVVSIAKLHNIIPKIPNPDSEYYKKKGVKLGCFSLKKELLLDSPIENSQNLHEGGFALRELIDGSTLTWLFGKGVKPDRNINIEGFFQFWQLLKFSEQELRDLFFFEDDISKKADLILNKIKTDQFKRPIVGVHVRLGDQLGDELNHSILPIEYYRKAFKRCKELHEDPIFLIVSDEPEKSKKIYTGDDIIYADQLDLEDLDDVFERTHSDIDSIFSAPVDMCILSKCDSVIIANSTFSWWAAWLNKPGNIFVPIRNKWFGGLLNFKNMSDFYPPEWEEIWFPSPENTKLTLQNLPDKS